MNKKLALFEANIQKVGRTISEDTRLKFYWVEAFVEDHMDFPSKKDHLNSSKGKSYAWMRI